MRKRATEQAAVGAQPTAELDAMRIIKGLLKALQVAHADKNTVLFDRIKSVLSQIARGSGKQSQDDAGTQSQAKEGDKDSKLLMTEVMGLVLKPTKDKQMHQAYTDCFFTLTKQFCDSNDKQLIKFVAFTYQELMKKYLGGRGASAHCLNQQFFLRIFEQSNTALAKSLIKPLLKYLLPGVKPDQASTEVEGRLADSEMSGLEEEKGQSNSRQLNSRSNHQRLQAIEIFTCLVKASQSNKHLLAALAAQLDLIGQVMVIIVKSADSWGQKKVKKTMLALGVFTRLIKTLSMSKSKDKYQTKIEQNASVLVKAIEAACEKDKSMSNLKGKVKEIQKIMKA